MDINSAADLAAAALTAAAAGFACLAANRSWQASEALAGIERARRHEELTPRFAVALESPVGASGDSPKLRVRLLGPPGLGAGVQDLTIRIRDDRGRPLSGIAGGVTAAEVADQIWGPFRFTPGVDGADQLGRQVAPVALAMDESNRFQLERTPGPTWSTTSNMWDSQFPVSSPVRLALHCTAEVDPDPWDVWVEVHARTAVDPTAAVVAPVAVPVPAPQTAADA